MGIPIILVTFICLLLIFNLITNSIQNANSQKNQDFLHEIEQNDIVSHSKLTELKFININIKNIDLLKENLNNDLKKKYLELYELSNSKMINFDKSITNSQIKKTYGANNLKEVLTYQENYDLFLKKLVQISEELYSNNINSLAIYLLEIGVELDTDITRNYTLLADIYNFEKRNKKLFSLMDKVLENKNLSQEKIIKYISALNKTEKENV